MLNTIIKGITPSKYFSFLSSNLRKIYTMERIIRRLELQRLGKKKR